jgi:hypothetical protein
MCFQMQYSTAYILIMNESRNIRNLYKCVINVALGQHLLQSMHPDLHELVTKHKINTYVTLPNTCRRLFRFSHFFFFDHNIHGSGFKVIVS